MEAGHRLRREAMTAAALVVLLVASGVRADPPTRELTLQSLDGAAVRPFASAASAWVFVFTRTDCPIAARYAPELQGIERRAVSARMAFHLVFVDPDETSTAVRTYLRDYGFDGDPLRDPAHRLVHLTGATTTPEAAVFVPSADGPMLVYQGRIDDRYVDVGRMRPAPTRHDLEEVLTAVAKGERLALRTTPAIGCLIADVTR
jgi:hypothetical protein